MLETAELPDFRGRNIRIKTPAAVSTCSSTLSSRILQLVYSILILIESMDHWNNTYRYRSIIYCKSIESMLSLFKNVSFESIGLFTSRNCRTIFFTKRIEKYSSDWWFKDSEIGRKTTSVTHTRSNKVQSTVLRLSDFATPGRQRTKRLSFPTTLQTRKYLAVSAAVHFANLLRSGEISPRPSRRPHIYNCTTEN